MDKQILNSLEQIKWLMVLQLQNQGTTSKDIAQVLGIDPATISRKVPRHKKISKNGEEK